MVEMLKGMLLMIGLVEYEDKTPATASQMAKDVVHFLNWTASPEHVNSSCHLC
jgi:cytochrome c1